MTFSSLFPYLFVGLLIALAIGAGIMLLLGSKNASGAGWAVTILFFGVGALAVVALVLGFDGGGSLLSGQSAWVEPGGNLRTLSLGLHDEPMSWIWILASALVGLAFLASRDLHSGGRAPHRLYAALAVEMAACGLCWVSYSAWSALFACGLALAGGVILLGTHSGVSGEEARFAFRYALERFGALVMALLGVLTLAWHGVDLVPGAPAPSVGTGFPGGWILAVGAYLMVRPFPLLGWAESPSQVSPAGRILVAELLPGIAAYGLIHEAAPTLKQLGVFPLFGVVPLAGMALTMLAGLFQQDPSRALSCWLSAAFCAGLSALAWAGPTVSDPLLLGTLLGCAGFIVAVGSLERGSGGWASPTGMVAMAGAASATGMFGFLAAGGHF
ncbi:MAG TPA: hypothetical protein VL588_12410, partial [Bdellovibrionota bacterium]|nr:hypothetical protein [Bdellovibrionota bacterium]